MQSDNIIEARYAEWTDGLSPEDARINIFEQIRDIPYLVIPGLLNLISGPRGMLRENKGSCTPKHYLLGMMYERLGLRVRYCTYPFRWKDMETDQPGTLRELGSNIPITYHLACKTMLDGRWTLIDATWDLPLKAGGFPVNENWDGRSDTLLAVKPIEEIAYDSAEERENSTLKSMSEYTLTDKLQLQRFTMELNRWLGEVRRKA